MVGGDYSYNYILADTTIAQHVFSLYPNHETVYNEYKEGYYFLEDGLANPTGTTAGGHQNYTGNTGGVNTAEVTGDGLSLQVRSEPGQRITVFMGAMNAAAIGFDWWISAQKKEPRM